MPQRANVARLRSSAPVILPSLLLCDFGNLEREVRRLEEAGVEGLHLDVMDGCFVPNLTYGMPIVQAIRRLTDMPLDVHLMIVDPEQYVGQFSEAGADVITFHVEAVKNPRSLLERIRDLGAGAGLAMSPETELSRIDGCLDLCDLILAMSVAPGFGKQKFDEIALDKLRRLKQIVGDDVMLEVDGGVNKTTIERCAEAGAGYFVVGSAIFGKEDYGPVVRELTQLAGRR
ncbi:MAG: ribulose-phosphate 3-epimerase [Planctomycetes bacterium]|nr:ribulose-phosphate 3-epimerase [Planctomycetota bacterium]MBL7040846.1 ribulose-phosphate 3-epimerase [Pirellulaceae bacterium]